MALTSLLRNAFPTDFMNDTANETSTLTASIPASILEAFLPGYGGVTRFIHQSFGFDITIFVSAGVVIWLVAKIGSYLYDTIYKLVAENFMCSININSLDDIYYHLMKWLAAQDSIRNSRSLMAETTFSKAWDGEDEEGDGALINDDNDSDDEIDFLNFSNQEAKAPPRYIPHFGSHRFWWKGNLFLLHRVQKAVFDIGSMPAYKDQEVLTLTCFGRSAQPIKNLLQDAKDFYLLDHSEKTVIRRPSPKDMRRYGGRHCWVQIADRPCRPMETVVLDHKRKREVLCDINEYLHPATPRWYANRGIPYRRGYLFHGPPGTGKTSLSFALAGVFGLDIYVISLLEPTLTEEDLGQLFNALPRRCVVLLEDIDTAGLIRPDKNKADETSKGSSAGKTSESGVADLVKALKKANETTDDDKKKGISLSGLLNAIDGVASHEGRVLVMTTNKPEALDDALIRPGRVDLQVAFGNATQEQTKELFERMYTSVHKPSKQEKAAKEINSILPFPSILLGSKPTPAAPTKENQWKKMAAARDITPSNGDKILTPPMTPPKESSSATNEKQAQSGDKPKRKPKHDFTCEELQSIAASFASKIPDGKFSPAEIQGFLLKRKRDPKKADDEIERWVEAMIELKKNESKVLDVQ